MSQRSKADLGAGSFVDSWPKNETSTLEEYSLSRFEQLYESKDESFDEGNENPPSVPRAEQVAGTLASFRTGTIELEGFIRHQSEQVSMLQNSNEALASRVAHLEQSSSEKIRHLKGLIERSEAYIEKSRTCVTRLTHEKQSLVEEQQVLEDEIRSLHFKISLHDKGKVNDHRNLSENITVLQKQVDACRQALVEKDKTAFRAEMKVDFANKEIARLNSELLRHKKANSELQISARKVIQNERALRAQVERKLQAVVQSAHEADKAAAQSAHDAAQSAHDYKKAAALREEESKNELEDALAKIDGLESSLRSKNQEISKLLSDLESLEEKAFPQSNRLMLLKAQSAPRVRPLPPAHVEVEGT